MIEIKKQATITINGDDIETLKQLSTTAKIALGDDRIRFDYFSRSQTGGKIDILIEKILAI